MSARQVLNIAGATFGCAAIAAGGVFLGRALRDPDAADATPQPATAVVADDTGVIEGSSSEPVTVAELQGEPTRLLPVLDPVQIGGDGDTGAALLDAPEPVDGTPQVETAGPDAPAREVGAIPVYEPSADEPSADEPSADEPGADEPGAMAWPRLLEIDSGWFERLGPIRIDPCAGATPGDPAPEGCPEGVAATFGGTITTPPDPFAFFASGHYTTAAVPDGQTCAADTPAPAPGEAAMTLFTRTPLAEVHVRYRPYGSDVLWTELPVTMSSPEAQASWWQEQFATRDYDIGWATLPICFNTPRDASLAYEIDATGTDVFGQAVRSNGYGVVSPETLVVRPPTTAQIAGRASTATVKAYSLDGGMVRFRSRSVDASEEDPACPSGPAIADDVVVVAGSRPIPVGVYDPAYSRLHVVSVPIPPGGRVVVCAEVFPDDNPLTPTATDRLLLVAPTQQRPRLVLQTIRRLGDATLPAGVVVEAGSVDSDRWLDPCGDRYGTPEIPPGAPLSIEQTLYECIDDPLPVDGMGRGEIPVTVMRDREHAEQVAVPITLDDCSTVSCERPREWYEVPIPSADGAGVDGIAVIRLEYPVIESDTDRYGAVTLLDQVGAAPVGANLRREGTRVSFEPSGNELHPKTRVSFFTDRPVQIRLTAVPMYDDNCTTPESIDSPGAQTEFVFEFVTMCAGSPFQLEGTATEPDGTVHVFERGFSYVAASLENVARVQVDFLGGADLAELGYIYAFDVSLDGQNPTAYWYDWTTPRRGSADACMALAGTTARSRTYVPVTRLSGAELDVSVRMTITTTGDGDCSGNPRTGLGDIEMTGAFTYEQLQSGVPLVLETAPDARLQLRLTLTTDSPRWTS